MTTRKLPFHDPSKDANDPILDLIPWSKRADRFFPPTVEPPVDDSSLDWLDEPIAASIVPNWRAGSPATQDPQQWVFKRARFLLRNLTRHVERNDKFRVGITPGLFEHGDVVADDAETIVYAPKGARRAATGDNAAFVALEFDAIAARWAHEVRAKLIELRLAHAIHSTFSDAAKSELGFETRCRLYLFPNRPLRTNEYTPVWMWWDMWLGRIADPAPKSIASVLYPPSHPLTEEARELAWATGLLGYRFDADAIVGAMKKYIREHRKKGDRKLVGDLSDAGGLSEMLVVETADGEAAEIGQLEDGTRFHAPDRDDAKASCTVWIDGEGIRRATDWSTGRHWRILDAATAEVKAWAENHRRSGNAGKGAAVLLSSVLAAASVAHDESVSSTTNHVTTSTVINLELRDANEHAEDGEHALAGEPFGAGALALTGATEPVRLSVPDVLPGPELRAIGVDEVIMASTRAEAAEATKANLRTDTTVILVAQPGVGKTQIAVELAKTVESVVIVNPLSKLARANASRFGVAYYEDVSNKSEGVHSVSTTIHSRRSMPVAPWLRVIDELSAILRMVHGTTCDGHHIGAYADLLADLATGACLCTGADISLEQIAMIIAHVRKDNPNRRFVVVKCTELGLDRNMCHGTQREIETHLFDLLAAQHQAVQAAAIVASGHPALSSLPPAIYGCADTVEEIEALAEETRRRFPGMLVGVIHGDSDDAPLSDIDAYVEQHRGGVVFMNHAAAEGISINVPVSYVVGIRTYIQVSAQTFSQLLCRPRVVLNKTVWVGQPNWNDGTNTIDTKVIRERILAGAANDKALRDHFWPGRKDEPVDCPEYLEARVQYERELALAMNHPQVELAVARYGWPAQRVEAPGIVTVDLDPARQAVRDARDERVIIAPDLDDIDASSLKRRRGRRTPEERAALERKAIKDFYGGEVTRERVKYDRRGKQRERLKLFAHARLIQRGNGKLVAVADVRARGEAHPACEKHVLAKAGILGELWRAVSGGALVGQDVLVTIEGLKRGREFILAHRNDLQGARYKVPSEKGIEKWILARLKDGGATVEVTRHPAGRDYEIRWPEGWLVENYENALLDAEQAEELREMLKAMRKAS